MSTSLQNILDQLLPDASNWHIQLLRAWPSIIGNLKTQLRLEKISDDRLIISVNNTAWLQEMHLLSEVLIDKINKTLDQPRIKRVRFIYSAAHKAKAKFVPCTYKALNKPVIREHEKQALSIIKHHALRTALELFLLRCKSRVSHENCVCPAHQPSSIAPTSHYSNS